MTSMLKKYGNSYRCSNCMMFQPTPLKPNCPFCGDMFANFESIMIKEYCSNESDLRRENYKQDSMEQE